MIRIQILNGPEEGRVAELGSGTHLVGRHSSAVLVLQGSAVSGRHLELQVGDDGTVRFRDLGSTNGTWSGGLKVQEGEWFASSELKVGDVKLRLLAEEPAGGADEAAGGSPADTGGPDFSDEGHRRAIQHAMGSKRRGGPLVFVLLLVAIGAAAAWTLLGGDPAGEEAELGAEASSPANGAAPAGPPDLLEGLGGFDEEAAASWQLGPGLAIEGETLRARGAGLQRAVLGRRFELFECGLRFEAEVSGGQAWPVVEFGPAESEQAVGSWAGTALAGGVSELALPCERAGWFRLSLLLEPGTTVRALRAEETEETAGASQPEVGWSMEHADGNLVLERQSLELMRALGPAGSWSGDAQGISFQPGEGWLRLRPGEEQDLLVLSAGPPLSARGEGEVEQATGMLLRGATSLWASFEQPVAVSAGGGALQFERPPAFRLAWKLDEPLKEAARLDRELRRAEQEDDSAAVLTVVRELANRWPIDEPQVAQAEALRDGVVARGRQELAALEQAVAEALFLAAEDEMRRVGERAGALAARFPGTEIEREAHAMVAVLAAEADQVGVERRERAADYRARLMGALRRTYPVLAAWMES